MRKLSLLATSLLLLFTLTTASAQEAMQPLDDSQFYVGASLGVAFLRISEPSLGATGFDIKGHFGLKRFIGDSIDLRGSVGLVIGDVDLFTIAADAIYNLPLDDSFTAYGGAGLRLSFNDANTFGVGLLAGADYDLGSFTLFGELRTDVLLASDGLSTFAPGIGIGVKFDF